MCLVALLLSGHSVQAGGAWRVNTWWLEFDAFGEQTGMKFWLLQ